MGTPPCESGFMKVTVAKRWETAERRTEYGFDGTSERAKKKMTRVKHTQLLNYLKAGRSRLNHFLVSHIPPTFMNESNRARGIVKIKVNVRIWLFIFLHIVCYERKMNPTSSSLLINALIIETANSSGKHFTNSSCLEINIYIFLFVYYLKQRTFKSVNYILHAYICLCTQLYIHLSVHE